jgi:peptidoglycan/xylan/chitin deacetylase (PgdA/CDA1 family)
MAAPLAAAGERAVAVTFDDLPAPATAVVSNDAGALRDNTRRLLAAITEHGIPAVGFVNEGKLFLSGESAKDAEARQGVLQMWVDAGLELGNHTYSHRSLNRTPLDQFQDDVIRGEAVTRRLLAARGKTLRYFRHPFLQVGLELDKRRAFESFLKQRSYTVAPVTIDNDDYVFAAVYADARKRGDREGASRIGEAYLRYMDTVFEFIEGVSRALLDREIKQVLLLHANALNADYFGRLAEVMKKRGYAFVRLEDALADPAYASPDTYVGQWGISWLHHWEISARKKRSASPDPPDWIMKAYEARGRQP